MRKQPRRKVNKNRTWLDRKDPVLRQFLKDAARTTVLDNDKIKELILKARAGDMQARNKIVSSNYRLLVRIAKDFQDNKISIDDLIQEGFFGIVFAINKYDFKKKVPFVNYAAWWVKTRILKYIWWHQTTVRLPESQRSGMNKLLVISEAFIQKENRVPTMEELLDMCSLSKKVVSKFLELFGDGTQRSTEDIQAMADKEDIPDNPSSTAEDIVDSHIRHDALTRCIDTLNESDKEFLKCYYGIDRPAILRKELAKKMNRSIECLRLRHIAIIKQLQENCMEDLSKYVDKQY